MKKHLLIPCILLIICLQVEGSQPVAQPSFTPCTFPTPLQHPLLFRHYCERLPTLPFVCDLHDSLAGLQLKGAEDAAQKYHDSLYQGNQSTVAVIIARNIEQPWRASDVYDKEEMLCLLNGDCLSSETVHGIINNPKTFLKVWTWKVYQRWFGMGCDNDQSMNVLILILIEGIANDARRIPYVKLYSGNYRLMSYLKNMEGEIYNSLVQNWELPRVMYHLVDDVGFHIREFAVLNGEFREHSVPQWARNVFLLCALLVIFALVTEWYIVRRKLAIKKSASGIKISVGKSKTHLMF
ncbi:unnamed protein product, partial [Mesorhabditis belari]|uniref:Uncharacterized protein n=1 Tax=Mesorhabditis belari TaxID=2138241 RepID=A0AAF3EYS5_9BILA